MKFALSFASLASLVTTAAVKVVPHGKLSELPTTGEEWTTLQNGMEFQPSANLSPLAQYHLRRLTTDEDFQVNSFQKIFVDGTETYYDEYAQAWRVLGWYIDCDFVAENNDNDSNDNDNDNDNDNEGSGCQRFLLWAAYIDEAYEGNGINEYKFYDRKSNRWNDETCTTSNDTRCVKMDCHEPNSHFSLLGFFKEPKYFEWMEQLFKYEGDCLWTDEEFQFMQGDREAWPQGCTESIYVDSGDTIYYDLKPEEYGSMSIGLYTDALCATEYTGSMTAHTVLKGMVCGGDNEYNGDYGCGDSTVSGGDDAIQENDGDERRRLQDNDNGNVWSLDEEIEKWNDAFDVYKQCQPCKAYDLTNVVNPNGYSANQNGDRHDNDGDDDGDESFVCRDDAGYEDVNQCMMFRTNTQMLTATWRDVELAGSQGSITGISLSSNANIYGKGVTERFADNGNLMAAWVVLLGASVLFGFSTYKYIQVREDASELNEPLVPSEGIAA